MSEPSGDGSVAYNRARQAGGTANPQNRRAWPRVRLGLRVRLRFPRFEDVVHSRTFDMSEGGAFIPLSVPRPLGTRVHLVLEVGERSLELAGAVMRISNEPTGLGIAFDPLPEPAREFVRALISARSGLGPLLPIHLEAGARPTNTAENDTFGPLAK